MMRTWNAAPFLLAFLWPGASCADAVDISEIGIRMLDLPSDATKPRVTEQFKGYLAALRIGEAQLTIFRLEDPVPSGSSVRDSGYRNTVQSDFGDRLRLAKAHAEATSVAGYDAWTISNASGFVGNAQYTCIRYMIVDQHLYRFRAYVFDNTGSKKIPTNFDRVVQAMSAISFEAVQRPEGHSGESVSRPPKMPEFQLPSSAKNLYPDDAKRRNEQGILEVEFSIDGQGHARDVKKLYVESPHLADAVPGVLEAGVFKIPPAWVQQGYQNLRFTMEIVFALTAGKYCFTDVVSARAPGEEVMQVCGSVR
jgi:Gram-negative bacterial TonB protein C-terminal